ncbi:hypothetical protein SAMN02799624_05251 [Paenibacillus sp. UNC496MF]|uniref:hypothetical protein n=1 Tax=Paenibacillus sp. UNC496MF TaxID=1502753 RepID=UPI0008DF267D|nr:hypothetical protein [Paenibacillus sp. UNC496MF]SFJ62893.1 hypothetical protein SAMN02799624_05251 [Paenibacillus sp. UNC496MF]
MGRHQMRKKLRHGGELSIFSWIGLLVFACIALSFHATRLVFISLFGSILICTLLEKLYKRAFRKDPPQALFYTLLVLCAVGLAIAYMVITDMDSLFL